MIDVVCIRGDGDVEAAEIQDDLIPSEFIARMRGTSFINENWWKTHARTLAVPYQDNVTIGRKVSVYESKMNIVGIHIITGHAFTITKEGIWSRVTVEQHREGT